MITYKRNDEGILEVYKDGVKIGALFLFNDNVGPTCSSLIQERQ